MTWTRRETVAAGLVALGASRSGLAFAQEPGFTDAELDELFLADAEPSPLGFSPKKVKRWIAVTPRPQPVWAERAQHVDYRHLGAGAAPSANFTLSGDTLARLAAANGFDLARSKERILFGLRGCTFANQAPTNFVSAIAMREAIPDHQNYRYVMGVWRRDTNQIWAARASTVPNVDYMYQMINGGVRCNMLPTGFHRYVVGTHRGSSKSPQVGAFRQADPVPVLRNRNNLIFEVPPKDRYDVAINFIAADNLHAAMLDRSKTPPFFSSAGCQVLPGGYSKDKTKPFGDWAEFRAKAGLKPTPQLTNTNPLRSSDDGRTFFYMLMTGAEANLAALGTPVQRLRFGSSGDRVKAIRNALQQQDGTRIDQRTMIAYLRWQTQKLGYSDGIVTPAELQKLG